ncbi:hypothetical protein [Aliarcobacter lanthieri]|uniref:hypothetical protein n=1 Tax=Aliarcobacter lanthieri TaxID=1355374 RepID=UPI00047D041C|nr:hypothetical protein [Aliarcobacter lanthieri]QKF59603.1 hypothetical protein ALANTH_1498 [Aliarcobacter lanthieri]
MKKILLGVIALIIVLVAVCFFLRSSFSSKIEAKIEELKANGFNVTYNEKFVPLKIVGDGKIEVVDSSKVTQYIVQSQKGEAKKALERLVNNEKLFSPDVDLSKIILEGAVFDYEFSLTLLTANLDLNFYLTRFSNKIMEDLPKTFEDMLKNRDFHINIDEDYNYKIKDINIVSPDNQAKFSLLGMHGNKTIFDMDSFKFDIPKNKFSLSLYGIKTSYEEKHNKAIDSTFDIKTIQLGDEKVQLDISGLESESSQKISNDLLDGNTKISIDLLSFKNSVTNVNLKETSFGLGLDKLPMKKYEEFIDSYYNISEDINNEIHNKLKELLKEIAQNDSEIKIYANSRNLNFLGQEWFEEIDLKSNITFSSKLGDMNFQTVDDVVKTINVDLKIDSKSAQNIANLIGLSRMGIELVDSEDKKFKILKAQLREDGIYANDVLILPKAMLQIPQGMELK